MPALFKTILPKYFVQWAKQVHNYDVSNEDIETLQNVKVNFLNQLHPSTNMLFNIFFDGLKTYISDLVGDSRQ